MDKLTQVLLAALKIALADPMEQRLFRSGKLPGLFASRTGINVEAADQAIHDGLLEVVRTEDRGKTLIEWVRPTPAAVDFLANHEEPIEVLRELKTVLQQNQAGLPIWLADIQNQIQDFTRKILAEVESVGHRLAALSQRTEDAIERLESAQPVLPDALSETVPWARTALQYLDRRNNTTTTHCSLSELFLALRDDEPELTIFEFHGGLRRLADRNIVRLHPVESMDDFPEPEYALLDGFHTYFYVSRAAQAA